MVCSVNGCKKPVNARGFCSMHYKRWFLHGDPEKKIRPNYSGVKCSVFGCEAQAVAKGMCSKHRFRVKRYGVSDFRKIAPAGYGYRPTGGYAQIGGRNEHRIIAERALGKPLPPKAEVHHVNEDKSDNRNDNLVICPSHAYHALLHTRTAALEVCGDADWYMCIYCKEYDAPENLVFIPGKRAVYLRMYHRECRNRTRRKGYIK